jgi:hypothetical protein
VALAAALAMAQAGAMVPARAAPLPNVLTYDRSGGWHVAATVSVPAHNVTVTAIDAASASDAWLAGAVINRSDTEMEPLIEHWNGSSWRRVTLPERAIKGFGATTLPTLIGAAAGRCTWVFGYNGHYLRLARRGWTSGRLPVPPRSQLFLGSAQAFGGRDAWAFGTIIRERGSKRVENPYAARFNGSRWRTVAMPGKGPLGTVSAISAQDMLALESASVAGLVRTRQPAILRWNGKAWNPVKPQPAPPRLGGSIPDHKQGSSELAMRWNGHDWIVDSPRSVPSAQDFFLAAMAADGQGGLWALSSSLTGIDRLWHYTRRRWSSPARSPWILVGMAAVPHTRSIWAISPDNNSGLILLHGQTPR